MVMSIPASAFDTGQPSLAAMASRWKSSSARPGTLALTSRWLPVMPTPGSKVTAAVTCRLSGGVPFSASPLAKAME